MEVIQIFVGFFLATLSIPLGYALFLYLPDEQKMIQRLFSWLRYPYTYLFVLSLTALLYPQPITAALLFVLFLPLGVVVQKQFLKTWLFSLFLLASLFGVRYFFV